MEHEVTAVQVLHNEEEVGLKGGTKLMKGLIFTRLHHQLTVVWKVQKR